MLRLRIPHEAVRCTVPVYIISCNSPSRPDGIRKGTHGSRGIEAGDFAIRGAHEAVNYTELVGIRPRGGPGRVME
jgi:hypothetical protein